MEERHKMACLKSSEHNIRVLMAQTLSHCLERILSTEKKAGQNVMEYVAS
jgi:hypothetical protein